MSNQRIRASEVARAGRVAVLSGLVALAAIWPKIAFGYDQLFWGSNIPFVTGQGPVLSPEIVVIFWGNWQERDGTPADPINIRPYIDGFAQYITGVGAPLGLEPVTRQYGVVGARKYETDFIFPIDPALGTIRYSTVTAQVHSWQEQGLIPQNTPNSIFLVLLKGSAYDWTDNEHADSNTCGLHDYNNGTFVAIVPWDGCAGSNTNSFQRIISHELLEAMTDPRPPHSWVTRTATFLDQTFSTEEGADQCGGQTNALSFGAVQTFADNTVGSCQTWTASVTPHVAATAMVGSQLEVVYPTQTAGVLGHATLSSSYIWSNEVIDTGTTGFFIGPPAVVSAAPGRLDAFAREEFAGYSLLWHFTKIGTGSWNTDLLEPPAPCNSITTCNGLGPPSAVSYAPNHIDVVVRDNDGGVLEFSSNDMDHYQYTRIGGTQTIGSPVIVARATSKVDVFTLSMESKMIENHPQSSGAWHGFVGVGPNTQHALQSVQQFAPVSFLGTTGGSNLIEVWFGNVSPASRVVGARFTGTSWLSSYDDGHSSVFPYGQISAAADSLDAREYDVVWQVAQSRFGLPAGNFMANHRFSSDPAFPTRQAVDIGGNQMGPPLVMYGSDGYPEVMGLGTDGCLYETWLDWWSGGPVANGPLPTGVCGLR